MTAQRHDPASLLSWFERMIRTLREAPEVGAGSCTHVDVAVPPGVLVAPRRRPHRHDGVPAQPRRRAEATVDLGTLAEEAEQPNDVLADQEYGPVGKLDALELAGYGYRWIRLRRR